MASLFDKTEGMYCIGDILHRMEKNCPKPGSTSKKLWKLRRKTNMKLNSKRSETLLEKSVSMLAQNGHMQGWFNQCPTASGIGDSSRNRHSNVDLVRWKEADASAWLVELKWGSNTPSEAIQQVLRYGAAYLYCRKHRDELPVKDRPIMDVRHIALCVLAPACFYDNDPELANSFKKVKKGVRKFNAKPPVAGVSMLIEVLALPESFSVLPFATGQEVKRCCDQTELTNAGRQVCDAFDELVSLYP